MLIFPKGEESVGDVGEQQHPLGLSQIARRSRDTPGAWETKVLRAWSFPQFPHLQLTLRVHPEGGESGTSACKQRVYRIKGKVEGNKGKGKQGGK